MFNCNHDTLFFFSKAVLSRMKGDISQALQLAHHIVNQCKEHKDGWTSELHAR